MPRPIMPPKIPTKIQMEEPGLSTVLWRKTAPIIISPNPIAFIAHSPSKVENLSKKG